MKAPPVKPGDIIGESFLVEHELGMGGMSLVVVALELGTRQRVAVKLLLPERAKSKKIIDRFQREQRTMSQLSNAHNLRYYGAGTVGSCPYIVMEYLEGSDLAEILRTQGPLAVEVAVGYVMQACEAVAEAHSIGIIHRDLKPGNLFLARQPDGAQSIKVLDFGISKAEGLQRERGESSLTETAAVFGSPFYMSPEQLISTKDVDTRADIWSLGVTLFELITDALPFSEKTTERVCRRILTGAPTRLRELRPELPAGLEAVLARSLERKPAARFATISDFALGLAEFGPSGARQLAERVADYVAPTEAETTRLFMVPTRPRTQRDSGVPSDALATHKGPLQGPAAPAAAPIEPAFISLDALTTAERPVPPPPPAHGPAYDFLPREDVHPLDATRPVEPSVPSARPSKSDTTTPYLQTPQPAGKRRTMLTVGYGLLMFGLGVAVGLFARSPVLGPAQEGPAHASPAAGGATAPAARAHSTPDEEDSAAAPKEAPGEQRDLDGDEARGEGATRPGGASTGTGRANAATTAAGAEPAPGGTSRGGEGSGSASTGAAPSGPAAPAKAPKPPASQPKPDIAPTWQP
ncbi:MAG: serine/threonine protein kinase [Deltaproteobacteria bacterium]|nr:serine/threonine protein kinase [Deltaproteobacteria bacterium]